MCGIVGCGGVTLSEADLETFEHLLHADVIRGHHATGVYRGNNASGTMLFKKAIPSPLYLEHPGWSLLRGERLTSYQMQQLTAKGEYIPEIVSNYYVGHNRWATRGASDADENAHPFKVGNVTLVHNGSLTGQWRLPDHKDFAVDSHNIAHSIEVQGIDATIQNLQGAFVLVWHDSRDNTLNFIRNSQRPLYMVRLQSGAWFWASEKDMLLWILNRRKVKPTIVEQFELEPGVHVKFDVSGGKFTRLSDVKHTFPSFYSGTTQSSYSNRNAWNDWENDAEYEAWWQRTQKQTQSSSQVSNATRNGVAGANALLVKYQTDMEIGDRIEMYPFQFEKYAGNNASNLGAVYSTSFCENSGDFVNTVAHGIREEDYHSMEAAMYGTIVHAKEIDLAGPVVKKDLEVIVSRLSTSESEDVIHLPARKTEEKFTPADIGTSVVTNCDTCGFPKDWEGTIVHVEKDFLTVCFPGYAVNDPEDVTVEIHKDNLEPYTGEKEEVEEEGSNVLPFHAPAVVANGNASIHQVVSKTLTELMNPPATEAEPDEAAPFEEPEVHTITKTLMDGKRVTEKDWVSGHDGTCCVCSSPIPFDEAETIARISDASVCAFCEDQVNDA